jgi:hypothetical protein
MTAIDTTALGLDDSGPTQTSDGDNPKSPRKRRTRKKP